MSILPADLTDKILYTKIYDEDNTCYSTTMQAKNFEAGVIYNSRKIATEDLTHSGLPVTIINTPNNQAITSKEEYIENSLISVFQTDVIDEFCEIMNIKGRGNSTWSKPKKPYAIKFNKKKSLMSLPDDKSWVLLANYFDNTLLRNDLALFIGNEYSCLDWTPHYQHVDLVLNGQYKGIYQLGEKVKISKGRVNVGEGGVLLEVDVRAPSEEDARYFNVTHIENAINIKDPDVEYDDDIYNFARNYVTTADDVLFSDNFTDPDNGWQKYLDMDSFVDWYLINEIAKNADAAFSSSCYMHLKPGGKLVMGPLWDFDLAFGGYPSEWGLAYQAVINNPENFHVKKVKWFSKLFQDPVFTARVKERFNDIFYANKQSFLDHIDSKSSILVNKVVEDNKLWGTITNSTSTIEVVKEEYLEQVNALKAWLVTRLDWLYDEINSL